MRGQRVRLMIHLHGYYRNDQTGAIVQVVKVTAKCKKTIVVYQYIETGLVTYLTKRMFNDLFSFDG